MIKNNTAHFPSLRDSLEQIAYEPKNHIDNPSVANDSDVFKYSMFIKVITKFRKKLNDVREIKEILLLVNEILKKIISLKEAQLFLFDDNRQKLNSLDTQCDETYSKFINNSYENGILDWIFENNSPAVLPNISEENTNKDALNFLVLPIYSSGRPRGVLVLVTPLNSISVNSFEVEAINILLLTTFPLIELHIEKNRFNSTLAEMQLYQSKLSNDFRLSAIGELTSGVIEDVMSPIQVILSCIKYIENEYDQVDKKLIDTIATQVSKVETVVGMLSKFANIKSKESAIYPCVINNLIEEYFKVIESSLKQKKYECLLDLDENVPPVLTKSTFINQLLVNLFGLIDNSLCEEGGILVQTRFIKDSITLKFILTDNFKSFRSESAKKKHELNLMMLENIMKLHEGTMEIIENDNAGINILLTFPLKRKIRQ